MILKFDPATSDRMVWMVSVPRDGGAVPVDFTTVTDEQRAFLGENGAVVDAEPLADGWEIRGRAHHPLLPSTGVTETRHKRSSAFGNSPTAGPPAPSRPVALARKVR